jgi:hypothetical protein
LVGVDLNNARSNGAAFFGADLTGADLQRSNLSGVIFVGANLSGADLRGADLTGAILEVPFPPNSGPDFSYQDLSGIDFQTAILSTEMEMLFYDPVILDLNETQLKEHLQDALLQGVLYDESTIWPVGFTPPPPATTGDN